jgi:transposase InsO family protein
MQAELSVAMDWYSRCVVGIRVTPVSTKAVDAASVLFQAFWPRRPGRTGR